MPKYIQVPRTNLRREDSENGRVYVTEKGDRYPSVTTVCSHLKNDALDAWLQSVGPEEAAKISNRAKNRGTRIHSLCEAYIKGETPKPSMLDVELWKSFVPMLEKIEEVWALETPLFSNYLQVAGTVDCVGIWEGKASIIDFKTSKRVKTKEEIESYFIQTAAYAIMWEEMYQRPIGNLVILMAIDDEKPLQFIERRKDWQQKFIELRRSFREKYSL